MNKSFFVQFGTILGLWAITYANGQPVPDRMGVGFPVKWDGDKYKNWPCKSENIPAWIDGYFLSQLSASYGDQSAPEGQKMVHMFDGVGAIASFNLMKGDVQFSGAYYPYTGYNIWNWYGRDWNKSKVAWSERSPYNVSAVDKWNQFVSESGNFPLNPNIDFWLVGTKLIGGTEVDSVGMSFDPVTLSDFRVNSFIENSDEFTSGQYVMLSQPIHERRDADGNIWNTVVGFHKTTLRQSQLLVTVAKDGTRTVQGRYDYAPLDVSLCQNGIYKGDRSITFGGYMHSITSTDNYIILPLTSALAYDTCGLINFQPNVTNGIGYPSGAPYDPTVNFRFLLFHKNTKEFIMVPHTRPYFVTHQFNAYEDENGMIIADMLAFHSSAPYNEYLTVETLRNTVVNATYVIRFTIDPIKKTTQENELIPGVQSMEFSQFNHRYTNMKYKYGYALQYPFALGSRIIKIDMDDHSGKSNKIFKPKEALAAVAEPVFIPSPDAKAEDDGVLLVRGIDPDKKLGLMYVVDAKTMEQIGEAWAPDLIPFGFHNQFFSRDRLGLPATPDKSGTAPTPATTAEPISATTTTVSNTATPSSATIRLGSFNFLNSLSFAISFAFVKMFAI